MASPSVSFVENGPFYSKFVFVLDRDKGLDKSLAKIFPNNHSTNCVHHIKQNVKSRFGAKAAEMVFPIAHAFSTIQEETLLEQLKAKSVNAYEYLEKIPSEHSCNTQWIMTQKYPPQITKPLFKNFEWLHQPQTFVSSSLSLLISTLKGLDCPLFEYFE